MSPLLPAVVAAMLSAVTVVACDRNPARNAAATVEGLSAQPRGTAQAAPAQQQPQPAAAPSAATPRDALSDTAITGRIRSAVLADPGMSGADVSVQTSNGVVSLVGNVRSQEQIALASAHAQRQDGVLRVDNELGVAAPR